MSLRRLTPAELEARGFGRRSERFIDTGTGETLSRRQAQNVALRAHGWSSRSEYERVMSDSRSKVITYEVIRKARADRGGKGVQMGKLIGPQTRLAQDLRKAARGGWQRSQQGPWARALIAAGMRADSDRYRVGFSPNSPRHRRRGVVM